MRILIVNKFARITGGADAYCLDLAAAMRARGHDVAFLSTSNPENGESEGEFVPVTVTRENRDALGFRAQVHALRSAFWNAAAHDAMGRLIEDFRPHVVSAHKLYPQLSVSPLVAAKRAAVPIVQTAHDYEFVSASAIDDTGRRTDRDEISIRFRVFNSSLFAVKRSVHRRSVAQWIAVSEFTARALRLRGIVSRVVPNPAPLSEARPVPRSERRGLVFAGRLTQEKGVEHLIRLAELLPEIDISVAGAGPAAEAVRQADRRLSNLHHLGHIDRQATKRLFAGALAVVVPSLWQEPAGLVTLEAMASGTPVVAYNVGGLAEYVGSTRAGIVVEPDPEELAAACATLVCDATAWNRISNAGLSAAEGGAHSLDAHGAAMEEIFVEAASV